MIDLSPNCNITTFIGSNANKVDMWTRNESNNEDKWCVVLVEWLLLLLLVPIKHSTILRAFLLTRKKSFAQTNQFRFQPLMNWPNGKEERTEKGLLSITALNARVPVDMLFLHFSRAHYGCDCGSSQPPYPFLFSASKLKHSKIQGPFFQSPSHYVKASGQGKTRILLVHKP